MATVGKSRAVVEIGPFRFGGILAWLAWLALHITGAHRLSESDFRVGVVDLWLCVFRERFAVDHAVVR